MESGLGMVQRRDIRSPALIYSGRMDIGRPKWAAICFIVGASMIACTLAAWRLGWGANGSGEAPDLWLAALFFGGAALLLVVLVQKLVSAFRSKSD
ncbi:hypothetical protein RCH21_000517 [Arthrobacter sp. PL16]|uniref:hypothetical protein n=1 Tax=Arthrobacter sp. PL16 TaxID=3071720 RepID=UPI002E017BEB|nr:hypothetical protein [Arthrobacter sp. PL16]